jgi:MoxR-like ATPase
MEEQLDSNDPSYEEKDAALSLRTDIEKIAGIAEKVRSAISGVIVGQEKMINELIIALMTDGHVIIEGVPGIGKTLTAKLLASSLSLPFNRIQFTPDLMPTDVIGTPVFNMKSSDFYFKKGPIFSNIVLIDEINRSPAKTQAALFEVMEERQITVDGQTYPFPRPFLVIATQNPVEQEGTYKLPEAQLDRFVFRIKIGYPSLQEELNILRKFNGETHQHQLKELKAVITQEEILEASQLIQLVYIKDELLAYIAAIIDNTRNNPDLFLGASPRASLAIMKTAKAHAAINGRDFVTPDDIKAMCIPVLNHRIILNPDKEMEGYVEEDIIAEIIHKVEVPR